MNAPDLLDMLAVIEPPDCHCEPAGHDRELCTCGHRIIDHTPKSGRYRPCERCHCRGLRRVRHP